MPTNDASSAPPAARTRASPGDADALVGLGHAHEVAGRLVEAINAYSQARRLRPDAALAHRIVELRYRALRSIVAVEGQEEWPRRDLPDPFVAAHEPPEIGPGELTAEVVGGSILHHGCVIVRGLQDASEALSTREMVIRSLAARDRSASAAQPIAGDDEWYQPFGIRDRGISVERRWVQEAGGMLLADSPTVLCGLLDLLEESGAMAAIRDYLGEPPALSINKSVLRKVLRSNAIWHQDGSFMGRDVRTVDVWLALSECGPGTSSPGLDIVPKRVDTILETMAAGATYPISIPQDLVDQTADDRPWVTPRFAPGDAILFDDRFVHRSGSGEGYTTERFAVESWFFAPSHFPADYAPILA